MAKIEPVKVYAPLSNTKITVVINYTKIARARLWLGTRLFKAAALTLGSELEIKSHEAGRFVNVPADTTPQEGE